MRYWLELMDIWKNSCTWEIGDIRGIDGGSMESSTKSKVVHHGGGPNPDVQTKNAKATNVSLFLDFGSFSAACIQIVH